MAAMTAIHEYRETLDYVRVVSQALYELFRRRSEIDDSTRANWERSVKRYRRSVEAFILILLPSLRPVKAKEFIAEARKLGSTAQAVEKLDQAVELALEELDRKGILIPKRVLEVGAAEGLDDAHAD